MSLASYADLQAAVTSFTHRSDLASIIPDLITIAEKRIFREVRIRVMETAFSGTIANGVIALPSDYLDLKFAYINATPTSQLDRMAASQIYAKWPERTASGKPNAIARQGSNFIFGPYPDSSYAVAGIYYAQPVGIATTANALFTANPDLYLFATLAETAPYIGDDAKVQLWEGKYGSVKAQLEAEDDNEYGSGGGLTVSVG